MPSIESPKDAAYLLQSMGIDRGADFYALNMDKKVGLLRCANVRKYREPKNANGSRARYFHEYLQRQAAKA